MAVEIQKQIHIYTPTVSIDRKNLLGLFTSNDCLPGNTNTPIRRPVVHNFEHDMESIFWLLLWTLLVRFPCNLDSNEERSTFAGVLSEIFQDTSICSSTREGVFREAGTLNNLLTRFLAPELKPLQASLDGLRNVLVAGYMNRKYDSNDLSSYSTLYEFLRMTLNACQCLAQGNSLSDLLPCRSLYLNSDAAQVAIVNLPLQVNKRRRNLSNAGNDDDEYRPVSSKMARALGHEWE